MRRLAPEERRARQQNVRVASEAMAQGKIHAAVERPLRQGGRRFERGDRFFLYAPSLVIWKARRRDNAMPGAPWHQYALHGTESSRRVPRTGYHAGRASFAACYRTNAARRRTPSRRPSYIGYRRMRGTTRAAPRRCRQRRGKTP